MVRGWNDGSFFKSIDHAENNIHKLVVRFRGIGIEL